MTAVVVLLALIGALVVGTIVGVCMRWQIELPGDRSRQQLIANQLSAQRRVEELTQATLNEMRSLARHHAAEQQRASRPW